MKYSRFLRATALLVCLSFTSLSISGCAMLRPDEYPEHGYKGEAVVKEGIRVIPVDWLGNLFGILSKLILWNWKVKRHHILTETETAVDAYLKVHDDTLGNVSVQLNRYAPQDAWKRLFTNKGVKWPYRLFLGTFLVLIADTLLIDRIFGGDRYNPFTHQVHIHSDLPSVALHELGHATDFAERRYRGSYALLYIVPFFNLYHEYIASKKAFTYVREEKLPETEIEAYKVLYPAYGTYVGSYLGFAFLVPVIVGHVWGRQEAHNVENRMQPVKKK
jgi:hypothetical protein